MKKDLNKVIIARIAWSETYTGGLVSGGHGYLKRKSNGPIHTKNGKTYAEAAGHEAYNFLPYKNKCYGYIPPSNNAPPNPGDNNKEGWLVVFVAPYMGYGGDVAVGWYKDASFEWTTDKEGNRIYKPRPHEKGFPKDSERKEYTYCVSADKKNVHVISPDLRHLYKVNDSIRKNLGHICVYPNGHTTSINQDVQKKLMSFVKKVVKHDKTKAFEKLKLSPKNISKYCPPPTEVKKEIEDKAIQYAKAYYKKKGFTVESVERYNCGWDLTITHKKTDEEKYVEVKGTSRPYYHFFLSRNEYNKRKKYRKKWVLFLVKDIGRKTHPPCTILKASEVKNTLTPFAYEGEYHPKKKKK